MELTGASIVRMPPQLGVDTVGDFRTALHSAMTDDSAVVVLIGATTETFCTGLAIDQGGAIETDTFAEVLALLADAPKPTLAFIDGTAIGGGFGLACTCDWIIATEHASFGLPELLWGLIPAMIWPAVVGRLGANAARRWTVSAHSRSAREAMEAGAVDELVSTGTAESRVVRTLQRAVRMLARLEPGAARQLRRWQREAQIGTLTDALSRGAQLTQHMANTPVTRARVAAFSRGESPWL